MNYFFLAKPKLSHFIQNQWVQSSWYNLEIWGLELDKEALEILWATLFACLRICDTTKSVLLIKRLLHWDMRSPNSFWGMLVVARASDIALQSVSNQTLCIPFDMATLIASNKSMVSASRIVVEEW